MASRARPKARARDQIEMRVIDLQLRIDDKIDNPPSGDHEAFVKWMHDTDELLAQRNALQWALGYDD